MLDRALMKRLRDSDSDSDPEDRLSMPPPQRPTADRPTDILTTEKLTETQVRLLTLKVSHKWECPPRSVWDSIAYQLLQSTG